MDDPRIVNLSDLPWVSWTSGRGVAVELRDPARRLGSSRSGFRLYRLAPGTQATRMHRHLHQEEMFLILKGSGTLRHGERQVPVREGDFILYPAGDPAAHTFINSGSEPMEYLATGNRVDYEVCEYPEEGTVYVEVLNKTLKAEEVPGTREEREQWYKAGH
ncbi:MAG: cupin domain-containing protein [Acidobacteria bacterium]|nr:cupin domain-containing protein [Acidobacteriota bacterium]